MEASTDFEQAGDAARNRHAALAWLGDARQYLQQCRFAGAVAADDAENLASPDLEADISQRPEFLDRVAGDDGTAVQHVGGATQHSTRAPRQHVPESDIAFLVCRMPDLVLFAEPFGPDCRVVGQLTPGSQQIGEAALGSTELRNPKPQQCGNNGNAEQKTGNV